MRIVIPWRSYSCTVCERTHTLHAQPTAGHLCPYCGLDTLEYVELIEKTERLLAVETEVAELRRMVVELRRAAAPVKSMPTDTRGT